MYDQAQALRAKIAGHKEHLSETMVYSVTSGKGGVGKSNITLNLALGLIEQGKKVVVIDGDLGFANLDILMGKTTTKSLIDLTDPTTTIWDVLADGPAGLQFIAGGSGFQDMVQMTPEEVQVCLSKLSELQGYADVILIDTGAGLNDHNLRMILASDEMILVSTPEPTAITDAYALVKMVTRRRQDMRVRLVVNRAHSIVEGRLASEKLTLVSRRFLEYDLTTLGYVLDDSRVGEAVVQQVPYYLLYPTATASRCIQQLARAFLRRSELEIPVDMAKGGMKGFIQRMVGFLTDVGQRR